MRSHQSRPLALMLPAGIIACGIATSTAMAGSGGDVSLRELTPWIQDVIKTGQGLPSEMDWNAPYAPTREEAIQAINARPVLSGPELTFGTDHFLIHYTLEGRDIATEDQVAWAADALEVTWNREINELGYPEPPSDGTRGGDARYDVYWTFQIGTYGYCSGETLVDENSMTSYLALGQWMNQVETQVTVAHEFFHALHFAMDALEETWWFEVTATWMEDLVYDDINDYYNYLDDPFENPETPINSSTSIMYGHAIWGHTLSERFGADVIKDIWFKASESAAPAALATNLSVIEQKYGDSWARVLHNFRESMFDLSRFSEGDGYALAIGDGSAGEVSMTTTVTRYATDGEGEIEPTAANLIEFEVTGDEPGTLTVEYTGSTGLVASLLVMRTDGSIEERFSDTMVGASATFELEDFGGTYTRAVMVVSNSLVNTAAPYSFSVDVPEWHNSGGCSIVPTSGGHSQSGIAGLMIATGALIASRRRR